MRAGNPVWWLGVLVLVPAACVSTQRPLDALGPSDARDSSIVASALQESEALELSATLSRGVADGQRQQQQENGTDEAIPFLAVQLSSLGISTSIEYAECGNKMSSMPGEHAH